MAGKRAAIATVILALIGVAIGANLAYVHAQIAASATYTSWCSINSEVNCNVVLGSPYAYFLGIPVADAALLTYLGIAAAAAAALLTTRAVARRRLVTALFAVAVWSVGFSIYLLCVSIFALDAICLLCSGLYVVNLGLLVSTAWLYSAARTAMRDQTVWQGRSRVIGIVAAVAVLVVVGVVSWKASQGDQILTAEEIKQKDPEFYAWYDKLPTITTEVSGGHTKGPDDALVSITEFSDFECGHCAFAYRTLKQVLPRYHKDIQVRFHHFPLDSACNPAVKHSLHQYACLAAIAAECAGAQGHFWEYHDLLFDNQSMLNRDSLLEYAQRLGLDHDAFLACLESDAPRQAIARDVAEGLRLGIESTPTLYVNGRTITGAPGAEQLTYAIQLERAAKTHSEGS